MDDSTKAKLAWHVGRISGLMYVADSELGLLDTEVDQILLAAKEECQIIEQILFSGKNLPFANKADNPAWVYGIRNEQ